MNDTDCVVLLTPGQATWAPGWLARQNFAMRRLRLTGFALTEPASPAPTRAGHDADVIPSPSALHDAQAHLCRFQVCLLPIDAGNLSWTRTALACAQAGLRLPTLGVVDALRAEAIGDLMGLGLCDFMTTSADSGECRARCLHAARTAMRRTLDKLRVDLPGVEEPAVAYGDRAWAMQAGQRASMPEPAPGTIPVSGRVLGQTGGQDTSSGDPERLEPAALTDTDVVFKQAKARVVAQFESQFLDQALRRHGGNVARAARACAKHRRAFWALMRKHGIDAQTYRDGAIAWDRSVRRGA